MTLFSGKFFYPFLIPGGLIFGAALFALARPELPDAWTPLLRYIPPSLLAASLLIGWRFNRSRLIFACLLLMTASQGLLFFGTTAVGPFVTELVPLLVPLNILLISLSAEKGAFNYRGGMWLALLLGQLVAGSWLYAQRYEQSLAFLQHQFVPWPLQQQIPIGQPALLAFCLTLLTLTIRFWLRPGALEAAFFWAVAIVLAGVLDMDGHPLTLYCASANLILLIGAIETSHSMAYRDELTGLPERRALNETMAKLGRRYTVAMLDIDHFKKFNDTHGHDVGDQVLKMVASKLAKVSGGGKMFRYGGEEFSVIFPRTSIDDALPHLEEIRKAVASARFIPRGKDRPKAKPNKPLPPKKRNPALNVTISIGAAERRARLSTAEQVIKAADEALYRAKNAGRNRVCA